MRIRCLLIANRGEIARRIARTARSMGIRTVAVYVDDDRHAPHVADCDDAIRLATGSYLDIDAALGAAREAGADAVHPGYGFLSENAGFARSVLDAGLVWVGPPPAAIAAMGDKLAAKRLAVESGVPTLPMTDDPARAEEVGYPILVKAAAGGGGKGMRVVERPADLEEAVAAARREALGAFGDDRVFLERYVARSRHVEVQVLGDAHGGLVHLGERECSIQRRHQKIVEESPSPVVDDELRARMGEAALAMARSLGYQSAGTVEFLVDAEVGLGGAEFWFLEVNTRLQVEHPVTEAVTGLDLVREQLRIAAGEPLGFGQADVRMAGHAVEVRLYAEDPSAGFLPSSGALAGWRPADVPGVRWDSGVEQGTVVGTSFDPMLAKVIAHAPTRAEAAGRLALALARTHIAGPVTNRDALVAILGSEAFGAGDTTTDFLDRVRPALVRVVTGDEAYRAAVAAALWLQGANRRDAPVWGHLPTGWRNSRTPDEEVVLRHVDGDVTVRYRARRDGSFRLGGGEDAVVVAWADGSIDVEVGGRRLRAHITRIGDRVVVHDGLGDVELTLQPRFVVPGSATPVGGLVAPMPGRVVEVRVRPGDLVAPGDVVLVLEAMKMEHRVLAPMAGVVREVMVAPGDQVANGAPLVAVDENPVPA